MSKLDSDVMDSLMKEWQHLETKQVEYGYVNPNVIHPTAKVPVASVAFWNNNGTKSKGGKGWHIPPRPFMDLADIITQDEMDKYTKKVDNALNYGRNHVMGALNNVGADAADNIREAIDEGDYKALAPSTVKGKSSDTILIESGVLAREASHVVTDSTGDI